MTTELNTAFMVLFVGMTTVFVVLALVVLTGNSLIKIVNHFSPIPVPAVEKVNKTNVQEPKNSIESSKLAAISAAVTIATGGKGRIENIKKIE